MNQKIGEIGATLIVALLLLIVAAALIKAMVWIVAL